MSDQSLASAIGGEGIGIGLSLVMGALARHEHQITIAKEENGALNQSVAAVDSDIKTIFDGANQGTISENTAMTLLQDVWLWYWQYMTPFQVGNIKGNHCIPDFPNQVKCFADSANPCAGKDCTAACCVGCNSIGPSLSACFQVFKNHGGSATICKVYGSKYGGVERNGYTVSYTPPAKVLNVEATINVVSGLIAIGASPTSKNDIVVNSGDVINSQGQLVSSGILGQLKNNKFLVIGGIVVIGLAAMFGAHKHAA